MYIIIKEKIDNLNFKNMGFDTTIICTDCDNQESKFLYKLTESQEDNSKIWTFHIVPENLIFTDWFSFVVTEVSSGYGKITIMSHNGKNEYIAKGIPDKMIEEASNVLNLKISSSSNKTEFKTFETEWRSLPATKVWDRLVTQGRAKYNLEEDIFYFIG